MQSLTDTGRRLVDDVAARHGLDADAVAVLLAALAAGGGGQAQFNHPSLGGMGQWSAGGMIMIGDMFNNALKAQVAAALADLATGLARGGLFEVPATPRRDGREGSPLFAPGAGFSPWPSDLGHPAASGAQNDLHYAYFPDSRRLAIRKGGHVTLYDTADHAIGGVSQQQGGSDDLSFTSQRGTVRLSDLAVVGDAPDFKKMSDAKGASGQGAAPGTKDPAAVASPRPDAPRPPGAPEAAAGFPGDILSLIERLAALRDRGILSDGEFEAKKAELLSRL